MLFLPILFFSAGWISFTSITSLLLLQHDFSLVLRMSHVLTRRMSHDIAIAARMAMTDLVIVYPAQPACPWSDKVGHHVSGDSTSFGPDLTCCLFRIAVCLDDHGPDRLEPGFSAVRQGGSSAIVQLASFGSI
jgi:hypothetical protein